MTHVVERGTKMLLARVLTWFAVLAMAVSPIGAADAAKVKYGKSEMDKALGKCVGSLLGGALLGALIGRAAGKNSTGTGAAIGAGAGGVVCAILIANARHRDQIVRAQIAAASEPDKPFTARWNDDSGNAVLYTAMAKPAAFNGEQLNPVKYEIDGRKVVSPVLADGPADCRSVEGKTSNGSDVKPQVFCRTDVGEFAQYEVKNLREGQPA